MSLKICFKKKFLGTFYRFFGFLSKVTKNKRKGTTESNQSLRLEHLASKSIFLEGITDGSNQISKQQKNAPWIKKYLREKIESQTLANHGPNTYIHIRENQFHKNGDKSTLFTPYEVYRER